MGFSCFFVSALVLRRRVLISDVQASISEPWHLNSHSASSCCPRVFSTLVWFSACVWRWSTSTEFFGVKGLTIWWLVESGTLNFSWDSSCLDNFSMLPCSFLTVDWTLRNSFTAELTSSIVFCCSLFCVVNRRISSLSSLRFVSCPNSPLPLLFLVDDSCCRQLLVRSATGVHSLIAPCC